MPKKSTNKREIGNTSINSNSGIDDNMKKHKMDEEVSNEEISIMILDGGSVYFNKPAQLKVDFDRLNVSRVIKETKITVGKHLIITFNNEEGRELFLSKRNNFKKDIQIIDLKKKTKYEIVLKGLNFTAIDGYKFLLSKMGIIKISQMNKANENFRMVKAECENEETMRKCVKEGIKLDYYSIKVEELRRQIKPLQCYNCQQYGHVALNCPQKDNPVCVKCAGEHKVDVCDNEEIKCANCEEEHKSSSSECRIYQVKLDEKLKVINKSNPKIGASVRQYSQVVDTNRENETLKDTLIASITDSFQTMQMKIDASFSAQTTELKKSIQKVEADVHLYKAKEFYVHCDMFRIMNNNNPLTSEQLRAFHDSFKFHHNFEINMTSAASYNKNGGHKKKNNKEIMYLNE